MKLLAATVLLALAGASPTASVPAALTQAVSDCPVTSIDADGGYQFLVLCPVRSPSPDGRYAVVRDTPDPATPDGEERNPVRLVDAGGQIFDDLPAISDGMPFKLYWSPRSDWFFVNHYQGSGHERLRLFQVVNGAAVERSTLFAEAARLMIVHYPCLGHGALIFAAGAGWDRAGRRVALYAYARPDACWVEGAKDQTLGWATIAMIGDAESGRIDPASVRVLGDNDTLPSDGPYSDFTAR